MPVTTKDKRSPVAFKTALSRSPSLCPIPLEKMAMKCQVLDVQKRGGSYDQAADFWGLGAVLFATWIGDWDGGLSGNQPQQTGDHLGWFLSCNEVMLCGRYPFDGQKQPLDDQIRTASYCMSGSTAAFSPAF